MQASFLQSSTSHRSPLSDTAALNRGGSSSSRKHTKELAVALPLTSLIDAFCIIVIYLLIATQSGGLEVNLPNQMHLPSANAGDTIDKELSIIRVQDNQYFINDQPVAPKQMGLQLFNLKKSLQPGQEMEVLIQADRKLEYEQLSPILKAAAEASIQKIKFAVMAEK